MPARLEVMCAFANAMLPGYFIHPAVRAMLLHLWVAYDHPFVNGNGRTARALFYWAMLHSEYWMFEFISISGVLQRSPSRYYRAILYTETDGNDATYFLVHQVEVIRRAVQALHAYIDRKTRETREIELLLRDQESLNHRQIALVSHALRHPGAAYTIAGHRRSHNTAYDTARRDLLGLVTADLLMMKKRGKQMVFSAAPNLAERLRW